MDSWPACILTKGVVNMNRTVTLLCLLILTFAPACIAMGKDSPAHRVIAKIKPAIVQIQGTEKAESSKQGRIAGSRTGLVIDAQGVILTQHSAIQGFRTMEVVLDDGRRLPVKAVLSEPTTDVAIVIVDAGKPLTCVELADSEKVLMGETVLLIESGYAGGPSFAVGMISQKGKRVLRVDTALSGPLSGSWVNMEGKLIGLESEIVRKTNGNAGRSAVIPSNQIIQAVGQLQKNAEKAKAAK
jgi:serine protease Do